MNAKHLKTIAEILAALKPLHIRLYAVGDELLRAYSDQSGEWRYTAEGDAANDEICTIEEASGSLETTLVTLMELVFLFSDTPEFTTIMGSGIESAPLPDKLPSRAQIIATPHRPGAPPYPFLKRVEEAD